MPKMKTDRGAAHDHLGGCAGQLVAQVGHLATQLLRVGFGTLRRSTQPQPGGLRRGRGSGVGRGSGSRLAGARDRSFTAGRPKSAHCATLC